MSDHMHNRRTVLGASIPFLAQLPAGLAPVAHAEENPRPGLVVLGDRPLVLETPAHLLDDDLTPAARFFVRNNGQIPDVSGATDETWRLKVDGAVARPLDLSIAELKARFAATTLALVIECAGNGRKFYRPPASGNAWTFGGVGCAAWTGVRLGDVLKAAGVTPRAVYTGHEGADPHLSGDPKRQAISRGLPIAKAMDPHTLIAWAMNGAPLPVLNGYPLRLVAPGFPGSCSQKWLTRIWVRDRVHDGEKMTGEDYRLPAYPIAPGADIPDSDFKIIEEMPLKSLITRPQTGARVKAGERFLVRGQAWAGGPQPSAMHLSLDFGATWIEAALAPAPNRFAWRRFSAEIALPQPGYFEVWARATDEAGRAQPPVAPGWNPKGYNNNQQHRIAVFAL
jgi:DMSO/TMAO reductase YedYZ molybdopterin-dependent catalytic subunit